jgi:DnaJ-class molecular chaperone
MQLSSELSSADRFRTHYDVLGVSTTADANTIRSAFYNLARQIHPDKRMSSSLETAENDFTIIHNAYSVLSDEHQRREYDFALKIRCLQNQHQETNATRIQKCDCREIIVRQSGEKIEEEMVELVYTCRCGNMIEISFADEKTNLIACSMCSLQYDTVLLWKEGENDENY